MPTLSIDGREIEVAKGVKVIEAAEQLGILIPRFCYHPALGSVGACRVCAVMVAKGPVQGVQMSCLTEALDGMVVFTDHPEAVAFRKQVIEWLMMNHPHDCPVCDEGGHCLLQDLTVAGGHGLRRYHGKKRTYRDQHLGTFVQHEMNRCIHCYRCWRFYQGFAGGQDLGCLQIANRTYFGRVSDGPLESPFSGNMIDLCPTGVFTDKPARFIGRRWDFERGPSLCLHCALGCNTVTSARYREIVRQEARFHKAVNGFFICDRGRYGFFYESAAERPRYPKIGKEPAPWGEAMQMAADTLSRIRRSHGPGAIACLGSGRSSLENQGMLKWLCEREEWELPGYFETSTQARKIQEAVSRLDERVAVSMREIEGGDFILAIGADPANEAPMLTLAMRQVFRNGDGVAPVFPLPVPSVWPKGNPIIVLDPRPVSLPLEFIHLPLPPADLDLVLRVLIKRAIGGAAAAGLGSKARQFYDSLPSEYPVDASLTPLLSGIEQRLRECHKPVIVCGTDIVRESTIGLAADFALLMKAAKAWTGLFYLMPTANSFGAALFSSADRSLEDVLEGIEKGIIKSLVVVEYDPFWSYPDRERLTGTLKKLDLLLVLDYLASPLAGRAHIFFPTSPLFETRASFVNQEGRVQFVEPVHRGGIPIAQTGAGSHPPRNYGSGIPGGEPRPAWRILAELAETLSPGGKKGNPETRPPGTIASLWRWLAQENPVFGKVSTPYGSAETREGPRLIRERKEEEEEFFSAPSGEGALKPEGQRQEDLLEDLSCELLLVEWTFGTEELAGYSRFIREAEKSPRLFMQAKDAARLGLKDQDKVRLSQERGSLEIELTVVQNMAPGIVVLPRHRQLNWRIFKELPLRIPFRDIQKA